MNSNTPPNLLILDLAECKRAFAESASRMQEYQFEMNEVVEGVICHVNFNQTAEAGLENLANTIITQFQEEGNPNEGYILATATMNFGIEFIKQLRELRAYNHEGVFPYMLDGWLDPDTPLLALDKGRVTK
jgi:hypothetical protein